eukprot:GEZU01026710.1.p1 GENE.GEZU01026710.1~~GEZU01026710.1.p1  ORF type:complete len:1040 (+),score=368.13 GEZU01026710.1:323-3442(+)
MHRCIHAANYWIAIPYGVYVLIRKVRQMAAVLMRKKLSGYWTKQDNNTKQEIKKALLQILVHEKESLVRHSVTNVVSAIAKFEVPSGTWNELLQFLFECTQSPEPGHREVAMVLFNSLTETVGTQMKPHYSTLCALFAKGLQDAQSPAVQLAALKAVGGLVQWIDSKEEVAMVQQLIPSMLNVIRQCLANGSEDMAVQAFEIFHEIVELEEPIFDTSLPMLVQFMLETAANMDYELHTREQAITFVGWVANYKPKVIMKNNMLGPILQTIFHLLAEPEDDVDVENDEVSAFKFSYQLLDDMAMNLPPHLIFGPVMEQAVKYTQSQEPLFRKGGLTAIAVLAQGCADQMKENLAQILPVVYKGFQDPDNIVRETACVALGQFAEWLQPEIIEHYQQILPIIFQSLNDPTDRVKEKSCYTLDAFCENLGKDILPYIQPLMDKLFELLRNGKRNVQEIAVSAISSTATAAGAEFKPYFENVLGMMKVLMTQTGDAELILRARATECVGLVALAVGREAFQPYLEPFINLALDGIKLDYSEIREFTYGFFANIAMLLESDFNQVVPTIIEQVFASLMSEDGVVANYKDEGDDAAAFLDEDIDEDDDADIEEERTLAGLSVRTSFLDEKASAAHTLGCFASTCKFGFLPYIERSIDTLINLAGYFHEDVRRNVITSLKHMALVLYSPHNTDTQHAEQYRKNPEIIMNIFLTAIEEDEDMETVGAACDAIGGLAKELGSGIIAPFMERLVQDWLMLLKRKALCQRRQDDDEDEEGDEKETNEEEELLRDQQLIDAVSDCIDDVAKAYGQAFEPFFRVLFPELFKFLSPKRSDTDRIMAFGSMAIATEALLHHIAPYVPKLFPLVLNALSHSNQDIVRNSVYCCGLLMCYGGVEQMSPYLPQVLQRMHPLFDRSKYNSAVTDNACSTLARVISLYAQVLPLNQIIPVFVAALPLREDLQENEVVYDCLFRLIEEQKDLVAPHMGAIMKVFAQVLGTDNVSDAIQANMVGLIKSLHAQYPQQFEALLNSLDPKERAAIISAAQQQQL